MIKTPWIRLLSAIGMLLMLVGNSQAAVKEPDTYALYSPDPSSQPGAGAAPGFEQFLSQIEYLTMPEKIRIRHTGDWRCSTRVPYTVVTVDFKTYVKQVLPQEWYSFWPEEALRAGAVAVKMYAWYWIERGGKWWDADVYGNTCDQWYRPGFEKPSTNQAVDDTWAWVILRDEQIFEPRHKVITACDPPLCMNQAVSARLAYEGFTWQEILEYFYAGSQLFELDLPPADETASPALKEKNEIRLFFPIISRGKP